MRCLPAPRSATPPVAAVLSILLAALAGAGPLHAEAPEAPRTLGEALRDGKIGMSLRYRFESVSDDAPAVAAEEAHASTLRTTLSYGTAAFRGFSGFIEFEDVTDLGLADRHNNAGAGSFWNGVTDRPVIADIDVTETHQAWLRYAGFRETRIDVGRLKVVLGNERFVGPVGWRQHQQTFDALRIDQGSIPRTALTYLFVSNVNRIFGDDHGMQGHLFNAEVGVGDSARLTPYAYILDYDDAIANSTATFGAHWTDRRAAGAGWTIPYRLEWARQRETGDNPNPVDADYLHLEVEGRRERLWVRAGFERLDGSAGTGAFQTPLATLHAFNGWADKFLVTPPDGLEDLYFGLGASRGALSATLIRHEFKSQSMNADYGTELDAQLLYEAPWKQTFGIAAARYDAQAFAADTRKLFVWTSWKL